MRKSFFILFIPALFCFCQPLNSQSFIIPGKDAPGWTIGNVYLEREIRFSPDTGLYTSRFVNKLAHFDMSRVPFPNSELDNTSPAIEFSFFANGIAINGNNSSVSYLKTDTFSLSNEGKRLVIFLRAKNFPLLLRVNYEVYQEYPVIRKWISVTNEGKDLIILSHFCFDEAKLFLCPSSRLELNGVYGVFPREIFYTGRVEDCAIFERDPVTGNGIFFLNEAPGFAKRTEANQGWNSFGSNAWKVMYDTDLFPFERSLSGGETFISSASDIVLSSDGKGFLDPHWVMPSYTSRVLTMKGENYKPLWIYNTWEPFWRNIDERIVMQLVDIAGKMGFDVFTIDDAWQADYGSNEIDPKRFPGGLDRIRDAIEKNHMRLGLWVPMATIGVNTPDARNHPEWMREEKDGSKSITGTSDGAKSVMCLATPYRELAAGRINALISRYHLKYVKLDLTTVFNAYGESPGCFTKGHDHRSWSESLIRIYEGIHYITEKIYTAHPDVMLDLTFELWGHKHIIDYGLLASGDLDWLSNVDDFFETSPGPRQVRTLLYQRALAIPVESMLIGNLQAQSGSIEERFATVIGSAPLLLGDLRKLSPQQIQWYSEKIAWYKKLRKEEALNQGFFPLGSWMQPADNAWDGFARLSCKGNGFIAAFRNDATNDSYKIEINALPEGQYKLTSILTGLKAGSYSSDELKKGVILHFEQGKKVEILEIMHFNH